MPAWHCRQHRLDETDGNHRLLMGRYGNIWEHPKNGHVHGKIIELWDIRFFFFSSMVFSAIKLGMGMSKIYNIRGIFYEIRLIIVGNSNL